MSTSPGSGARVRVTRARRGVRPARTHAVAQDLREQTGLGDVYLAGLMRAQLRLALVVVGLAVVGVGGFPLLLALVPSTRAITVFGIPFPWLVLGVLVYPTVWALAWWYARQAERIESEFSDLVGPS
jgi:hypothetical protein